MKIKALIDVGGAIRKTKTVLCIHSIRNSMFLDLYDWRDWILVELDNILSYASTVTLEDEHIYQMGDVGFPTDVLTLAKNTMRTELVSALQQAFGPLRDNHHYSARFIDRLHDGNIQYELLVVDMGDYRLMPKADLGNQAHVPDILNRAMG